MVDRQSRLTAVVSAQEKELETILMRLLVDFASTSSIPQLDAAENIHLADRSEIRSLKRHKKTQHTSPWRSWPCKVCCDNALVWQECLWRECGGMLVAWRFRNVDDAVAEE